jgi:hypothetical protein
MAADWRRVMFVAAVMLVGTLVVVVALAQAPLMRRTIHNPMLFWASVLLPAA